MDEERQRGVARLREVRVDRRDEAPLGLAEGAVRARASQFLDRLDRAGTRTLDAARAVGRQQVIPRHARRLAEAYAGHAQRYPPPSAWP
jgi:hypothetical protein